MELLQLQYFIELARMEHVTEAAKSLHVTQSSLSKTLQRLEEDLGVPLFDRKGRRLQLNEFGRSFLIRAERALFELEQGRQEISDLSKREQVILELAVTTASTLPNILREFRKKLPNIQFHVQMLTMKETIILLRRGEVDFCLSSPSIQGDDFESQVVYMDPILVAVPKGHPLAERKSVSLIELKDEQFVGIKKGFGTRDFIDSICKSVGFSPKYVYEGDEPARLSSLVEAEIGIAFMPSTAMNLNDNICYLAVGDQEMVREIALVWHKGRYFSQAAQQFHKIVVEYFNSIML